MGLEETIRSAPRDWRVIAGMSLMYVWTWLLYWGGPFTLRGYTIELVNARWAANVITCAVVLGAVSLASCRVPGPRLVSWLRASGLVCGLLGMGLGLLLVLGVVPQGLLINPVALMSGVFTGACEGSLLALWCTITSSLGMRVALTHNLLSMLVGGLLFLACNLMPVGVTYVVGMLCPVGGFACSRGYRRYEWAFAVESAGSGTALEVAGDGMPTRISFGRAALIDRPVPPGDGELASTFVPSTWGLARIAPLLVDRSFLVLVGISLLFGVSSGFVNASFEVVPAEHYRLSCQVVVIGTILAAALTFLTAFLLKMDAWQLVFRTSLPLMGVAYLLFPYDLFWFVGPGLHALGYQYFFITFWSLLGSKQVRHDVPALCSVSLGLFVTEAGAAVGLCVWMVACAGVDEAGLRVVSSVATFLVLVAAVSLERPRFGWGNVRPGARVDAGQPAGPDYDGALARIRASYGLSPREADVCSLLGRGRNRQFVADELGISLETAKTHVTNIYRKLGIHSQQELLDVVEMTCENLARERGCR